MCKIQKKKAQSRIHVHIIYISHNINISVHILYNDVEKCITNKK